MLPGAAVKTAGVSLKTDFGEVIVPRKTQFYAVHGIRAGHCADSVALLRKKALQACGGEVFPFLKFFQTIFCAAFAAQKEPGKPPYF